MNSGYPLNYRIPYDDWNGYNDYDVDYLPVGRDLPPTIQQISPIVVYEGENVTVFVNCSDSENASESLYCEISYEYLYWLENGSYEYRYQWPRAKFSKLNMTYGTFIWSTLFNESGIYTFFANVSDGYLVDSTSFNVTVLNANQPPVLDAIGNKEVNESNELVLSITGYDPDNQNDVGNDDNVLTYSVMGLPDGAVFFNGTTFIWTPGYWQEGTYDVTFIVSDGELQDDETITITVGNTAATDLSVTPSDIIFSNDNPIKDETIYITATFINRLEVNPSRILVSFYDGLPESGTLIGNDTIDNTRLAFGDSYFAQTSWETVEGPHDIYVVLDPLRQVEREANWSDNVASRNLIVRDAPDFFIRTQDIAFSNPTPKAGTLVTIYAMIHNAEDVGEDNVTVGFYFDSISNPIALAQTDIGPNGTKLVTALWTAVLGTRQVIVIIDPSSVIEELNETNNQASKQILVTSTLKKDISVKKTLLTR